MDSARSVAYDDMPSLWDGFARLVRAGTGLSSFGANLMNLPPDYTTRYHDETATGQEELYVAVSGSGAILLEGGERLVLDADHVVAVPPDVTRATSSDGAGLRVLIIGGAPGKAYEPQDWSSQGE
jgi:hypothetical protein